MLSCNCRNPETCRCVPVLDVGELKDRIRALKTQRAELQQRRQSLQEEIETKTQQLQKARQTRLYLDPDPDLRLHLSEGSSSSDQHSDLNDPRFRLANEKLEMSLLIQEIRSALPSLEQEVRWRERLSIRDAKTVSKLKTTRPPSSSSTSTEAPSLWMSSEELRDKIQVLQDEVIRLQQSRRTLIQRENEENLALSVKLGNRRRDLARLHRERDMLIHEIQQLSGPRDLRQQRLVCLRNEHLTQREKLRHLPPSLSPPLSLPFVSQSSIAPYGFHAAIFAAAKSSPDDEAISLSAALSALRPWLFPPFEMDRDGQRDVTLPLLCSLLSAIQREDKDRKQREVFGDDALDFFERENEEETERELDADEDQDTCREESMKELAAVDEKVDLRTLSRLIDRVCIELDC